MTVERKIREFLNRDVSLTEAFPGAGNNKEETPAMQGSSQKPEVQQMHTGMGGKTQAVSQKLAAGAGPKEGSAMKQGSSRDATIDSTDNQDTQGKTQAAKAKKQPVPMTKGAGNSPNYKTVSDPSSVINQSSSAGNVYKEDVDEDMEDEYITEDEFNALSDEEQSEYEVLDLDDELEESSLAPRTFDHRKDSAAFGSVDKSTTGKAPSAMAARGAALRAAAAAKAAKPFTVKPKDSVKEDYITEEEYEALSEEEQAEYYVIDLEEGNAENKMKKNAYTDAKGAANKNGHLDRGSQRRVDSRRTDEVDSIKKGIDNYAPKKAAVRNIIRGKVFGKLSDTETKMWAKKRVKEDVDLDELDINLLSDIIAETAEEYNLSEEQINELSKKTLGSYINKAANKATNHAFHGGISVSKGDYNDSDYQAGKESKRLKGIHRAAEKLTKEEVEQIDELSSAAYNQYIKRARKDVTDRAQGGIKTMNDAEKIGKRVKGIRNAKRQLANEELEADIAALFGSDATLSEEFKEKAASLFEAVVSARIANIYEELEEEAMEAANEYIESYTEDLVEQLDGYLTYVSEHWLTENAVAVETGLRNEISEDFMNGLKTLFQEHYIDVPEDKYDLVGALQAQIKELTNNMDAVISENINLNSELIESYKEIIINNSSSDLAQTEVEKLRGLVESVEFDNPELFEEKVTVIKNSYFPKTQNSSMISEELEPNEEAPSSTIAKYAELLTRGTFTK